VARYDDDPGVMVRALTDRIAAALRALVVEADDRRTLQLVKAVERLWGGIDRSDAAARTAWMRRVMAAYATLRRDAPGRVSRFREGLERYEKDRELAGLGDPIVSQYSATLVTRYALREGGSLLLGAPLALWGLCAHAVPYQLTRLVVRLVAPE